MPSKIEWTDETWAVVTGCTPVSPGCANCPAARMAATRLKYHPRYAGLAEMQDGKPRWTGEVRLNHDVLGYPASWRKPRRVFVASMGDLFHEDVPESYTLEVWSMMSATPQHTYQLLTKRSRRMLGFVSKWPMSEDGEPLSNIWLGVTIENQETADARREAFRAAPAAIKFVSYEPALGPVDWTGWEFVDQIISGGETGPGARPGHPDWHRVTRDFCQANRVKYFFKQHGTWVTASIAPSSSEYGGPDIVYLENGESYSLNKVPYNSLYQNDTLYYQVGKSRAGRLLDGRKWSEMP